MRGSYLLTACLRACALPSKLFLIIVTDLKVFSKAAKHTRIINRKRFPVATAARILKHKLLVLSFLSPFVAHAQPPELQVPAYRTRHAMSRLCEAQPDGRIQRENKMFVRCADLDLYFTLLWIGDIRGAKQIMQP